MTAVPGPFGPPHPDYIQGECYGFAWVGQALTTCNTCARPFWEHRYEAAMNHIEGWYRKPISKDKAAAVKVKWDQTRHVTSRPAVIQIERDVLVDVVIYHTKTDIKGCRCGWSKLGESWAEHVADVIQERSIAP